MTVDAWRGDPADIAAAFDDPNAALELVRRARPAWQQQAACRGMPIEAFFPQRGGLTAIAVETCGRCRVAGACQAHAVEHDEHGIWSGTTRRQRSTQPKEHPMTDHDLAAAITRHTARFGIRIDLDCAQRIRARVPLRSPQLPDVDSIDADGFRWLDGRIALLDELGQVFLSEPQVDSEPHNVLIADGQITDLGRFVPGIYLDADS